MSQLKNKKLLKYITFRIKELRKERNITQEIFYFDTNIHIGRIEQGKLNISVSTMYEICKYFNVSMSDFFKNIENGIE